MKIPPGVPDLQSLLCIFLIKGENLQHPASSIQHPASASERVPRGPRSPTTPTPPRDQLPGVGGGVPAAGLGIPGAVAAGVAKPSGYDS